jgi:hypothetical protein
MISIKALVAVTLSGLGAAAMSADVYLVNQRPLVPAAPTVLEAPPSPRPAPVAVAARAPAPRPLQLEPVTIYARAVRPHVAARPTRPLAVCSDWRSMDSGPASRGVRSLCLTDAPANAVR